MWILCSDVRKVEKSVEMCGEDMRSISHLPDNSVEDFDYQTNQMFST